MREVGVIEHEGNRFAADGATCDGVRLTAYVKDCGDRVALTNWVGQRLVVLRKVEGGREWRVNDDGDTAETLCLRCSRGRFIGGLSLGDGMLFRGEVFEADSDAEAIGLANEEARIFAEADYEDSLRDQQEQDEMEHEEMFGCEEDA